MFKSNLIKLEDYIGDKAFGKSLNSTILKKDVKIPVPPVDVQEKIIDECKKVESVYEKTRMKVEEYQAKIQAIFDKLEVVKNSVAIN